MDFNMKKSLFLHTLTSWTLSLSLGLGFMAHVGCANAQLGNFPSRPIKIIVPFVPGGTLDSVARLLAKHLTESLPQAVIVDNKGGGGGIVGVDYVAKSAPDGYTLVFNAATPKEIQLYLSDAIRKAVMSPDMSSKLKDLGMEPSSIAMDAFSEIVKRDLERWGKIIRDNNIKAD